MGSILGTVFKIGLGLAVGVGGVIGSPLPKHQEQNQTKQKSRMELFRAPAPMASFGKGGLGLAAGGAKDAKNFSENLERGYLPLPESLSYEGVFYRHSFKFLENNCRELLCPNL
ncbi:MAG: hypothetical protein ABGW77_03915, partial [Campylobacterales bacterium]